MTTISLTRVNNDAILIYQTLLDDSRPIGPLTRKAIEKALSHLASGIPLPVPSALTKVQIATFSKVFDNMKEKYTEEVFLSTVSNVVSKISKLFIFKGEITSILTAVPVTTSLSENVKNAQGFKNILKGNFSIKKPFSDLSSLVRNPEFEDFQDICSEIIQNKIIELERSVSIYIGLINDRFDSIPLTTIEHLDYLIESLRELLRIPCPQEIPIELDPLSDLLLNLDSYALSEEDQQAFKDLVIHRINKKIEEFQTMSPEQKEIYLQERITQKMTNTRLHERLKTISFLS